MFSFILPSLFLRTFYTIQPSITINTTISLPELKGQSHWGLLKPTHPICHIQFTIKWLLFRLSIGTSSHESRAWSGCHRNDVCQTPPGQHANISAWGSIVSPGDQASLALTSRSKPLSTPLKPSLPGPGLNHSRRESSQPIGNLTGFRLYAPFYCVYSHPARWSPFLCLPWPELCEYSAAIPATVPSYAPSSDRASRLKRLSQNQEMRTARSR